MPKKINSRQKGARGERELANLLTKHGYPARRGQQFSGSPDSPDVVCPPLDNFQIECKLVEALNIHKAIAQARRDASAFQIPVVMHKKNRTEWLCTLPLEDFLDILKGHPDFEPESPCDMCGSLNIYFSRTNQITCNHCSAVRTI